MQQKENKILQKCSKRNNIHKINAAKERKLSKNVGKGNKFSKNVAKGQKFYKNVAKGKKSLGF